MKIKSIDTTWEGYRFRSRLEARWAVYFKEMGWEFLYEPQGYDLQDGTKYLPDFYLPRFVTFVEIKCDLLTPFDFTRAQKLVESTDIPLVIIDRDPTIRFFTQIKPHEEEGFTTCEVNLIENPNNPNSLLENHLLVDEDDYNRIDHIDPSRPLNAVYKARAHRFGIFD